MVSSARRLNEHGQNVIESLMRSADQALRDSCSRAFEGLAEMMRERVTNEPGQLDLFPVLITGDAGRFQAADELELDERLGMGEVRGENSAHDFLSQP